MAKRFTDTSLYDHAWFRKLPTRLKCAWEWLSKRCDSIGIMTVDMDRMSFEIGEPVTLEELQMNFKVQVFDEDKIYLPSFVPFQYGDESGRLSRKNPFHRSIAKKLQARGFAAPDFKEDDSLDDVPPSGVGVVPDVPPGTQGRGIRKGKGEGEERETHEVTQSIVDECVGVWAKTLSNHGMSRRSPKLDAPNIGSLIQRYGRDRVKAALFGASFEESSPNYDASRHVRISRLSKPEIFELFENLGYQHLGELREVYEPEAPAC